MKEDARNYAIAARNCLVAALTSDARTAKALVGCGLKYGKEAYRLAQLGGG